MKVMETGEKTGFVGRLRLRWANDSHFGTVLVLLGLIILQTLVLGFDYDSVGQWFSAWGATGSTSCATMPGWGSLPWA